MRVSKVSEKGEKECGAAGRCEMGWTGGTNNRASANRPAPLRLQWMFRRANRSRSRSLEKRGRRYLCAKTLEALSESIPGTDTPHITRAETGRENQLFHRIPLCRSMVILKGEDDLAYKRYIRRR